MSIFGRRRGRTSTRAARTNARRAANLKRTRDTIRKTKIKNPNIALAQLARMQGKSTNKLVGQATNRANRPTEKQKKTRGPAVDPRPSVKRRLADAKRLTNVAAKAKKGTKNIKDVLTAAKAAAGRTKGPRSKRGPRV